MGGHAHRRLTFTQYFRECLRRCVVHEARPKLLESQALPKLLLDCVAREPPPKRGAVLGDVLELYDAAVANGEEPDTLTTNTLIRVCVTSGRPERAFAEFERNEARGARPPNLVVLQTLARGCQDASEAARDDHEAAEWMERCFDVYLAGKRLVAERKANFPRSGR